MGQEFGLQQSWVPSRMTPGYVELPVRYRTEEPRFLYVLPRTSTYLRLLGLGFSSSKEAHSVHYRGLGGGITCRQITLRFTRPRTGGGNAVSSQART